MTTAEYRNIAREAEMRADWLAAIFAWNQAIVNCPTDPARSAIAKMDIENMTRRRDAALRA